LDKLMKLTQSCRLLNLLLLLLLLLLQSTL
jgi:hypothetical protein